jgi:hypothetical protein
MALSLSPDEVVEMPIDALALRILRDVDETSEWNSYNWMIGRQHSPDFSRREDALRAFEEAWAWLRAKALVAHEQPHTALLPDRKGPLGARGIRVSTYGWSVKTPILFPIVPG